MVSHRIIPLSVPTINIGPLPDIGTWITSVNDAPTMSNISVSSSMAITSLKSGLPVPEDGSEIVVLQAFDPWPSKIKSKSPLPVCRGSIT